jgi:hypothetical protein
MKNSGIIWLPLSTEEDQIANIESNFGLENKWLRLRQEEELVEPLLKDDLISSFFI